VLRYLGRYQRSIGYLLTLVVVICLVSWVKGDERGISWPQRIWIEATSPLAAALSRARVRVQRVIRSLMEIGALEVQNRELRRQLAEMESLKAQVELLREENRQLRAMLGFRPPPGCDSISARVIARSPVRWFAEVLLDRGTADGVSPGQAVTTPAGLVGRVTHATPRNARVLLITDPASGVGVKVLPGGDYGVVLGQGVPDLLQLRFFSREIRAGPGDLVVTSGLGSGLPAGLLVGRVTRIMKTEDGLTWLATVAPSADLASLHYVLVLRAAPAEEGGDG